VWNSDIATDAQGSASLLGVALTMVAVVLGVLIADIGVLLRARSEAATAADAAALAAAPLTFHGSGASPGEQAARYAAINGATLLSCACRVDPTWATRTVTVVVAISVDPLLTGPVEVAVSSRAEFVPTDQYFDG